MRDARKALSLGDQLVLAEEIRFLLGNESCWRNERFPAVGSSLFRRQSSSCLLGLALQQSGPSCGSDSSREIRNEA